MRRAVDVLVAILLLMMFTVLSTWVAKSVRVSPPWASVSCYTRFI